MKYKKRSTRLLKEPRLSHSNKLGARFIPYRDENCFVVEHLIPDDRLTHKRECIFCPRLQGFQARDYCEKCDACALRQEAGVWCIEQGATEYESQIMNETRIERAYRTRKRKNIEKLLREQKSYLLYKLHYQIKFRKDEEHSIIKFSDCPKLWELRERAAGHRVDARKRGCKCGNDAGGCSTAGGRAKRAKRTKATEPTEPIADQFATIAGDKIKSAAAAAKRAVKHAASKIAIHRQED